MKMAAVTIVLAVLFAGCGGGSSSTAPTPVSTPDPGPARADLGLSLETGELCISPVPGFLLRVTVPLTIRENAGLQARANFFRFSLFRNGVEIERAENGANDIVADLGSNLVPAGGTLSGTARFDFNNTSFDSLRFEVNLTDAKGNLHALTKPDVLVNVVVFCTQVSADVGADGRTTITIRD